MSEPLRRTVTVKNAQGFHLRPVTAFAELAGKFPCEILIGREGEELVNGKSPITMMASVMAEQGKTLTLEVKGDGAAEAMEALVKFFEELVDMGE